MRRHDWLLGVAAAGASPLAALAQSVEGMRRIGLLYSGNDATRDIFLPQEIVAFVQALRHLGWTEGDKIELVQLSAQTGRDGLRASAKELVQRGADVIVTIRAPAFLAARTQTHTVPIVFTHLGDPSGGGVTSLAHPGRNVTGFSVYERALARKWLETLKQVAPHVRRAMILVQADAPPQRVLRDAVLAAAPALEIIVTAAEVRSLTDCEREVAEFAQAPDGGRVVFPNAITNGNSAGIQALARRYRLPAIYSYPIFARTDVARGRTCPNIDDTALKLIARTELHFDPPSSSCCDSRRTMAARTHSAIQPSTSPSGGLTIKVARAVIPMTHQHDGLPSSNRREIAKSVPARINNAPTAPIGINRNSPTAANEKARSG